MNLRRISLLGLLGAMTAGSLPALAVKPAPADMDRAREWAAGEFGEKPTAKPPFSFTYDGKPSSELLKTWKLERQSRKLENDRTEHVLTWTDPASGLVLTCRAVEYSDFPTVEWTLHFKNAGKKDSPILSDIQALDVTLKRGDAGEFTLHRTVGDGGADIYKPDPIVLGPGQEKRLAPGGGRPSSGEFPYFNIEGPTGGMIVAIGWPGQWAAKFTRDGGDGLHVTAGQELTHFKLLPGEELRSPLIVTQFWSQDRMYAQNVWRQWMIAHNLPRPGGQPVQPQMNVCNGNQFGYWGITEDNQRAWIQSYEEEGIKYDYWWCDLSWFAIDTNTLVYNLLYDPDPVRFPRGLKSLSDYLHEKGIKLIAWFEPEHCYPGPGNWVVEHHPEWLLKAPPGHEAEINQGMPLKDRRVVNLGNPDALKWMIDNIDRVIREQGIDYYRHDFNVEPLIFWRANDAPDRQGVTENKYVTGFLAYYDGLLARHPGMQIDNCASGGRRNDVETLRRSVPLLRSDTWGEPVGQQCQSYGLANWIPFWGTGILHADPKDVTYVFRSQMGPSYTSCWDLTAKADYSIHWRLLEQWRSVREDILHGDYYPLTPYSNSAKDWIAWQFDRPETGTGMVQAFRRNESEEAVQTYKLRGLVAKAEYSVEDLDSGKTSKISGEDLMEKGLTVEIKDQPGSALISYKSKITRDAAMKRLRGDYSLEGVARKQIEVEFDDLKGLSQPMTQRTTIQAKNHPDTVFVHPDLSIVLGAPADSYVVGFGLGTPAKLPAITETTREPHKGYQPIVKSRWQTGGFTLEQTAFGVLPADEAVVLGTEKQDVMVRVAVTNDSDAPATTALVLLTGKADGTQMKNEGYVAFLAPVSRWQKETMKVADVQGSLMVDGRVLLTYRTSAPTPVSFQPKLEVAQGEAKEPITVNNGLRFELQLAPRETRHIDFVMAGSSKLYLDSERGRMAGEDFTKALQKAESRWDQVLEPGMKLSTPEPRLNNIYKHLVLSCLQNVPKEPNVPWLTPQHSSGLAGWIWPCEYVRVSVPLDSLGFHKDTEPCLRWFTEHQSGVGKHGNNDIGPDGQVTSTQGCFVGVGSPRWMNETGCVLWMLAAHYRYSRDAEWLKANQPGILAAFDWIRKQRDTTRTTEANGKRVAHFGLLPKGRSSDWAGHYYYYCFTDGYTYKGMAEAAAALRDAGVPEAAGLSDAAAEYRRCIVDILDKVTDKDPETGLLFVPNIVYFRQGDRGNGGVWLLDGPRVLFDLGILDPVADTKYWQPLLEIVQRRWGTLGGLMCHFSFMESIDEWNVPANSPFWYVLPAEVYWHRDFLARGECEKALLVFYSSLVYAMSEDMFETVERVNTADSNFAPFQPNTSGNGLVLTMLRRLVIDEQDETKGTLWLLRGCPRRWFAPGKSIGISDAPTVFGKTALRTTCTDRAITIDIDPPVDPAMKQLRVAVRHPARLTPRAVTINGASATMVEETVTVNAPAGHLRIVAEYD